MRGRGAAPRAALADRFHLCFALGKALEDRGEYAESFAYYERGNALKKREVRYRPEFIERNTRLQNEVCTAEFFAARQGWAAPSAAPIFIVGLPRAGSTLIEQILASHSRVEGTMELSDIPRLVQSCGAATADADRPATRGCSPSCPEDFGARRALPRRHPPLPPDKPRFIDKMPNNFRHIGLIHLILPNAKIIDARREPMACCFSNFKQLFASGQEFTYCLEDIARYYRTYVELMAHWDRVLPGRVLRVQHEELVADLEGRCAGSSTSAGSTSSPPASSSTRPRAACARRAPSRCAGRSTPRAWSSGGASSRGSGRWRRRSGSWRGTDAPRACASAGIGPNGGRPGLRKATLALGIRAPAIRPGADAAVLGYDPRGGLPN